jgi:hypothetical protein
MDFFLPGVSLILLQSKTITLRYYARNFIS